MEKIKDRISLLLGKTKLVYSVILRLAGEEVLVNGVLIKDYDGQFFIEKSFEEVSLDNWLKQANIKYPLVISLSGDGITTRAVENKKAYLKKLLFNAKADNFYIYERIYKTYVAVSFCRKETLDIPFNQIKQKGFNIIHFSIGPCNMVSLLAVLEENKICSLSHCFTDEGTQLFYSQGITENAIYDIGDEKIVSDNILPISNYITYRNKIPSIENFIEIMNTNEKEETYKRILALALPVAVLMLILLTLSGHFVRLHLQNKLEVKDSELVLIRKQQELINNLELDLEKKEMIYSRSGFKPKDFFIKHISSITNSASNNIVLNQLSLQPLSTKIRPGKVIALKPGVMIVSGVCADDSEFKAWISKLDNFLWIEKIEIMDYSRGLNSENHFEIEVLLKS